MSKFVFDIYKNEDCNLITHFDLDCGRFVVDEPDNSNCVTPGFIAEKGAEHFNMHLITPKTTWPIGVYVFTEKDKFIGKYWIDLELVPTFSAREIF